jgi:hypothetical protein
VLRRGVEHVVEVDRVDAGVLEPVEDLAVAVLVQRRDGDRYADLGAPDAELLLRVLDVADPFEQAAEAALAAADLVVEVVRSSIEIERRAIDDGGGLPRVGEPPFVLTQRWIGVA